MAVRVRSRSVSETVNEYFGGEKHPEHGYTTLYRYRLERIWDRGAAPLLVIGCNPSTATAEKLDPTIMKVYNIARDNDYGGIIMCNLYAYRETSPEKMKKAAAKNATEDDPNGFEYVIGPDNEDQILEAANNWNVEDVVFAYGNIGVEGWGRDGNMEASGHPIDLMKKMMENGRNVLAFAATEKYHPNHPIWITEDQCQKMKDGELNWINLIEYYMINDMVDDQEEDDVILD